MSSRIEQIIEDIEEYVDSCKFQPLSSTKIVVNKEELEELLRELRMKTPDEIKRYQKIISNKDAILADAQAKADALIADAQAQQKQLVEESEVMQQAYAQSNELLEQTNIQAQEILDNATNDANNIRMGALQYTDEMLENLEKIMSHTIEAAGSRYSNFINSLQSCYDIVNKNRRELSPQASPASYTTTSVEDDDQDEA
jgi:F0F1-type ATP synthase membrane subunit b/b'